ncbi:MAG: hypothetical protein E6G67_01195 [Actinobacteria bacterium]|nr:MAG: hypothetical protein E6G67_01195 [Actinomycetota bacterium]
MMVVERSSRRRRRRWWTRRAGSRRGPVAIWAIRLIALGLAFWIGLAIDRPRPGGTQTLVRTLKPGTLPVPARTVTVTTSGP